MNSTGVALSTTEICDQIKKRGYAVSQVVRIYGEEFEILSDPFLNDAGVAVRARSRRTSLERSLQLPAMLVQTTRDTRRRAA